jgi:aryl-alcohol dehydrogenase-like predicted oxidoreductase
VKSTKLGRTGLEVSRIAFGTWQLGGDWGSFDEDAAIGAIHKAWDCGITLFDTAQGYGNGRAEQVLGTALRSRLAAERDNVVIATKGGIDPGTERARRGDREFLRAGVEQSLQMLGVEHIDLYQVHWPDPETPFSETAGALAEMVTEGKIRHVGVSNFDVAQMQEFSETLPVETLQPPYHLFRRGIEGEILDHARANDIGILAYSPLGSGLLTGAMDAGTRFEDDDWRSQATAFTGESFETNLAVVEELKALAAEKDAQVSQLAIAWVLAQPGVHVAIVGARSDRNIEASAAAGELGLTEDDLRRIEEITSRGVQVDGASPEGVA